jgi:hypothetical protein
LRDIIRPMRNLLLALAIAACGGHGANPAEPTTGAATAAFGAARWVPANPTYVIASKTVRDGQRALHDGLEDLGMAVGFNVSEASQMLQQLLGVDPLSADALAGIGIDLAGGAAVFSEDVTPTFVVHLTSPEAFASFIERERGRGATTVSTIADGIDLETARTGDFRVTWGVDKDWLWLHFGAGGTDWFTHSHHAAAAAWTGAWQWAQEHAGKASVVGFARAQSLLASVMARVDNGQQCLRQLGVVDQVGLSFDVDGTSARARLSFELGPAAPQLASHLLAPPPGWATAAQGAPLAAEWNLDTTAVATWWQPCAGVLELPADTFTQDGVRAARAFVLALDPDSKEGSGAVALDLSNDQLLAPYLDKVSHFSSDRTFGPYKGHHVAIPFVAKADYVYDGKLAIAAMGDGLMDKIAAGTSSASPPVFAASIAPGGMSKAAWTWLLSQAGPRYVRLFERLSNWQDARVTVTLEGSALVVEVAGKHR